MRRFCPIALPKPLQKPFALLVWGALCLLSAWVLAVYLRMQPVPLVGAVLAGGMLFSLRRLAGKHFRMAELAVWLAFAAVIALVLTVGFHIHVEDGYAGTVEQNYLTPFGARDALAWLAMLPGLWLLFLTAYRAAADEKRPVISTDAPALPRKRLWLVAAVLLACWLPYLLAYWPGIILGDTRRSLLQVLDFERLYNFQPVAYTLFIKLWVKLGALLFGSNTAGYALYTAVQMIYVSLCLSWIICWVWNRGGVAVVGGVALTALFGVTPYFAAFSIAGWKDPIFAVSVAVVSLMLLEDALQPQRKRSLWRMAGFVTLLAVIAFFRNNGIAVLAFLLACLIVQAVVCRQKWRGQHRRLIAAVLAVMLAFFVVSGPVYDHLEIWKDQREANGLVLQQMARTVVMDGKMTEHGEYYMHMLLPLNQYPSTYRPCCVDLLKWNENFDFTVIDRQMYIHWLTMLLHNPRIFVEAWVLNSFGFWTLNVPCVNQETQNLSMGSIQNNDPAAEIWFRESCGIEFDNLLGSDAARAFLPTDGWFIPAGWMFWAVVFLVLCMALKGQARFLIALAPTFGVMIPVIIATPIYYWSRYAAALYYLIPLYLALLRWRGQAKNTLEGGRCKNESV